MTYRTEIISALMKCMDEHDKDLTFGQMADAVLVVPNPEIDRLRQAGQLVAKRLEAAEAKLVQTRKLADNADPHLDRWGNPDGYCVDQEYLLAILNDEETT